MVTAIHTLIVSMGSFAMFKRYGLLDLLAPLRSRPIRHVFLTLSAGIQCTVGTPPHLTDRMELLSVCQCTVRDLTLSSGGLK